MAKKVDFNQNSKFFKPDHESEGRDLREFIDNYQWVNLEDVPQRLRLKAESQPKYRFKIKQLMKQKIKKNKRLDILIEDLENYLTRPEHQKLVYGIKNNTRFYQQMISKIVSNIIHEENWDTKKDDDSDYEEDDGVIDQIQLDQEEEDQMFQNELMKERQSKIEGVNPQDTRNQIHPLLKKKLEIFIVRGGQTKSNILKLRELKASTIGSLVTVQAIVLKVSETKPQIEVASYTCESCGYEIFHGVSGTNFTPLNECKSVKCVSNKTQGKLQMINSNCQFVSYQELIIQETSDQVPVGSVPRSFLVVTRGQNVRQCTAGDLVNIQGVYCPLLENTFKGGQKMEMETFLEAYSIEKQKKQYSEINLSEDMQQQIFDELANTQSSEFYENLANSIAPEIHGLEDVKKAMLLMMIGGDQLDKDDGMHIRGDINIALFGDPGIAKSQLLKQISQNAPRSVYTTGKGSSGVGLTASVLRDNNTGEVSLEAGALVLADKGVCCIDEFDKMNDYDRTAIHEVMEQQTVSIAKAGITTTLNARTSILAAANPLYSRYNKKKTPHENINMPAALLSRFDLVFILIDKADENRDLNLSTHILKLHQSLKAPSQNDKKIYSGEFLKSYVATTKTNNIQPKITPESRKIITDQYIERRTNQKEGETYTTPRTLLSIIRLATAHAKIRRSENIEEQDVDEAIRLIDAAQDSIKDEDFEQEKGQYKRQEGLDRLYKEICRKCNLKGGAITMDQVDKAVKALGLTDQDLQQCKQKYGMDLNLLEFTETSVNKIDH